MFSAVLSSDAKKFEFQAAPPGPCSPAAVPAACGSPRPAADRPREWSPMPSNGERNGPPLTFKGPSYVMLM